MIESDLKSLNKVAYFSFDKFWLSPEEGTEVM